MPSDTAMRCSIWARIVSGPPNGLRSAASSITVHSVAGATGRSRMRCLVIRTVSRRSRPSYGASWCSSRMTARA
ncbi:Uncharacterised protein [Mycobacterium tuberculosis]|nr:Uncharacterised protein [Mycobacterium tuberculosis]